MAFIDLIFADASKKKIRSFNPLVAAINTFESEIINLSDEQLKARSLELKQKVQEQISQIKNPDQNAIQKILDGVLVEAFALTREAAKRVLGMRHFDVQLIGGVTLHKGMVAEMKTGEGKTLVSTLPIYLNALAGRGVHVVTVNDYLAKRDAEWMGKLYDFLGLTVGVIVHDHAYVVDYGQDQPTVPTDTEVGDEAIGQQQITVEKQNMKEVARKEAYAADITYGTNNEYGFDYLKDNMVRDVSERVQRPLFYSVIDEIDSILIDEARTPLIISAPAQESGEMYRQFAGIVPNLEEQTHYTVDEKQRAVSLTDDGIDAVERLLGITDVYSQGAELIHHLEQALKAQVIFKKDRDYVVRDGEVVIVDEFTGRMMPGRRYSEGLHQAIEAKEKVEIKRESVTLATITFQNYFRLYAKLSGMTGTAMTESEELFRIYKLDVIEIPTHRIRRRSDGPDKIYKTEQGKFDALVREIKERHEKGQPVLVGTISIEKNELLSHLLKINGVPHELLNAKNHESEASVISQAGAKGAVTIATNMAGRGVDIILGGHPYNQERADEVRSLGGLAVFGTERHESRRIDNQLRGRAGRQGDPGYSQFYISLEDDLMRIFGGDRIKSMMNSLGIPDDQPIENRIVSRSMETAQKRVEGHNFDIRKHVLEYDDVMNRQRTTIYAKRDRVLAGKAELSGEAVNLFEYVVRLSEKEVDLAVSTIEQAEELHDQLRDDITQRLASVLPPEGDALLGEIKDIDTVPGLTSYIKEKIRPVMRAYVTSLSTQYGEDFVTGMLKDLYLRIIDSYWVRHLTEIDHLRTGIGLVGYGQKDPLVEYKHRAYNLFQKFLSDIDVQFVRTIARVKIEQQNEK